MAWKVTLNVALKSELYIQSVADGTIVVVPGESSWGDVPFQYYRYDSSSSESDNGDTVIKPTPVSGNGRYLKLTSTQTKADWLGSGLAEILNKPTIPESTSDIDEGDKLFFTEERARDSISLTTSGTSGASTYIDGVLNIPQYNGASITYNNGVSRGLSNGATNQFTISTTQNARVNYSINIQWSVLINTFSGSVFLEYNIGGEWITVNQCSRSQAANLTSNGSDDLNVSGEIPANALVRLRTTSTNCTLSYNLGQEVLQ